MTRTRVVQWATGSTGRLALRALVEAEDLELVGVRVYDQEKIGRDAGELAGLHSIGVAATDRTADVLASNPDVVLYMGSVEKNPKSCFQDVVDLLEAGADVITTGSSFIDVRAFNPARAAEIEQACAKGKSTFLGVGLFPGFWGEAIAPILSRLAYRCNEIFVREALSYVGYPSRELLFDVMGYGHKPESDAFLLSDPSRASGAFVGTATIVAKALGLEVESTEAFRETGITDTDLHVASGLVPAGTVGAIKMGVRANCGPVAIAVEHVTWMSPQVRPEWSQREGYEIEFGGAPSLRCNLELGVHGEDHTEMGCLATAMHAVHAIPTVSAAPPGILDLATAPGFVGRIV